MLPRRSPAEGLVDSPAVKTPQLLLLAAGLTALGLLGAFWLLSDEDGPSAGQRVSLNSGARSTALPSMPLPEPGALPAGRDRPAQRAPEEPLAQPISSALSGAAQIVGRVVDQAGVPQPDVEVATFSISTRTAFLRYQPTGQQARTNIEGRFRLIGVPPDLVLALEAIGPGHAPTLVQPVDVKAGELLDAGDIVLDPGVRLYGRVLDQLATPVPGATLTVTDTGRATIIDDDAEVTLVAQIQTDAEGRYEVPHLGRSQYTVAISAPGFAALESVISFLIQNPNGAWEQDFVIEQADRVLAGYAESPEGQAVPDVVVRLVRRIPNANTYYALERTTDADGRFRFDTMAEGRYDLTVESSHWYLPRTEKVDAGDEQLVLHLHPALAIAGQLVVDGPMPKTFAVSAQADAATGAGLLAGRERARQFDVPDGSGSFLFDGLRPGKYVLSVKAPGYAVTESQDLILPQEVLVVPVAIPLRPGGTLVGRLSDGAAGVAIELRAGDWVPNNALEFAFPSQPLHGLSIATQQDGSFQMQHVPAGRYVLSARSAGMPDVHVTDVDVQDGSLVDLGLIERQRGGEVVGQVLGADGQPSAGAQVRLTGPGFTMALAATLKGRYRFDCVPVGSYELVASPQSFFDAFKYEARASVDVRAGETAETKLQLVERAPSSR